MDPREIKALLKEARTAFSSRDYPLTLKNCKIVLRNDPKNYNALVLRGCALQEQNKGQQSLESFKEAIAVDDINILAWQGIAKHYERLGPKGHPDLLDAYKKMANFYEKDDKTRYIEHTTKLANALSSYGDFAGALKVFNRLSKSIGLNLELAGSIVRILNSMKNKTPEQDVLYTEALEVLVMESPQPAEETYNKYFLQLYKAKDYDRLASASIRMMQQWNIYYSPTEWLCRLYFEQKVIQNNIPVSMDEVTTRLFKLRPTSIYGYFARGKYLFEERQLFPDCLTWLQSGLESSYNLLAVDIILQAKIKFGHFKSAIDDVQAALRKSDDGVKYKLIYLDALAEFDVNKAATSVEKLLTEIEAKQLPLTPENQQELLMIRAKIFSRLFKLESLKDVLNQLQNSGYHNWRFSVYEILVQFGNELPELTKAFESFLSALEDNQLESTIEIGIILYGLKSYEVAASMFSRSTQIPIGAMHPTPWKYLGYISELEDDISAASTFYKKSYDVNPSPDVGAKLSDTYTLLNETEANFELLQVASKKFRQTDSKWVWVRLGLYYLNSGNADEAVKSLQAAIRTDRNDCHIWESLADAYFARGSYTAAKNAYEHCILLGADPVYPKLKIGVILQSFGHDEESIVTLKELVVSNPTFAPVHVEMAKSYHQIAKNKMVEHLHISAINAVQEALLYCVRAIQHSPTDSCLPWILVGDLALLLSLLPMNTNIKVPNVLCEKVSEVGLNDEVQSITLDKFLVIGTRAFFKALNSAKDLKRTDMSYSTLHYCIAKIYYYRSVCIKDATNSTLLIKSLEYVQNAIAVNQGNHIFWNFLGIVSYALGNYNLSQHSFIKSLQLESNNVIAWCNLGVLHLKNHDDKVTPNKIFSRAQSTEPAYGRSWAGQALVAELYNKNSDAMDLFRHSSQLCPSVLAVMSYSDYVCELLLAKNQKAEHFLYSIVNLDGANVAQDLLSMISNRTQSDILQNTKGILAGWNGLYETSLQSFELALTFAKETENTSQDEIDCIHSNKAALMIKLGQFAAAKQELDQIKNHDFTTVVLSAILHKKLGAIVPSAQLYKKLLELAKDDKERELCYTALGIVSVTSGSSDGLHHAKTFLFKCMNNPHALVILGVIGFLNNDAELVVAVSEELKKFEHMPEFAADIGFIRACYCIQKNQLRAAVKVLLKFIHMYPLNAKIWMTAANMILMYQRTYPPAEIRHIILTGIKVEKLSAEKHHVYTAAPIAVTHLLENNRKAALITALKNVRNYPSQRDNWAALVAALWFEYSETKTQNIRDSIARIIEREISGKSENRVSERVKDWFSKFQQSMQECG